MRLLIDIGYCEQSAKRTAPAGSCIAIVPEADRGSHGVLLACGEGVAGRPEREQAAKTAMTTLGDTYYAAADGWSPRQALAEGLDAAHQAVMGGGERGRAAVVGALVLHGRSWVLAHAGNVRVWRYRDRQLKQITRDHLVPLTMRRVEVTKACGLAPTLEAEYDEGELKESDIFFLTTPGMHDVLPGPAIVGVLQSDSTAQQMADLLVQRAFAAHAPGYVGVCIARVEKLPRASALDARDDAPLPVIDLPKAGATVDGFEIEKLVHRSRRFRLYKAKDRESDNTVVLRFPDPAFSDDAQTAQAFLREEWIGRRIDSPYVVKTLALRPGRRTALYSVMEYHQGENLAKRIRRKQGLPWREALLLGEQLLSALEKLHQQGVIHRDIRPNNLLYDKPHRQLRVLGLGSSHVQGLPDTENGASTSAMSYWAPELHSHAPASERTDLYAAGVTIYRMLTAAYAYGKIRSPEDRAARDYIALAQHKEGLPYGLDDVLQRACAADPANRYANAAQFATALSTLQATTMQPAARARTPMEKPRRSIWIVAGLIAALVTYLYAILRR